MELLSTFSVSSTKSKAGGVPGAGTGSLHTRPPTGPHVGTRPNKAPKTQEEIIILGLHGLRWDRDPSPAGLWKTIHNPQIPAALLLRLLNPSILQSKILEARMELSRLFMAAKNPQEEISAHQSEHNPWGTTPVWERTNLFWKDNTGPGPQEILVLLLQRKK